MFVCCSISLCSFFVRLHLKGHFSKFARSSTRSDVHFSQGSLRLRSEIILQLLGTPKSPNIYVRVSCQRIPPAARITIHNKYGHLRSCYVNFSAYICNFSTFFHIPGICPKIPSFSIISAIYSETSSFFKFCLYNPNIKFS